MKIWLVIILVTFFRIDFSRCQTEVRENVSSGDSPSQDIVDLLRNTSGLPAIRKATLESLNYFIYTTEEEGVFLLKYKVTLSKKEWKMIATGYGTLFGSLLQPVKDEKQMRHLFEPFGQLFVDGESDHIKNIFTPRFEIAGDYLFFELLPLQHSKSFRRLCLVDSGFKDKRILYFYYRAN